MVRMSEVIKNIKKAKSKKCLNKLLWYGKISSSTENISVIKLKQRSLDCSFKSRYRPESENHEIFFKIK